MAKVSPNRNSFNAGIFSALVEGRTDIDKYGSSMRQAVNYIVTPQGPTMMRPGTKHYGTVYNETLQSALIPFVFSDEQSLDLEFCNNRIRFHNDTGLQIAPPVSGITITQTAPLIILIPGVLDLPVGTQLFLDGFDPHSGVNGRAFNVTATGGENHQLDVVFYGDVNYGGANKSAGSVYTVMTPYAHTDVHKIRAVQSADVVYLFCDGYPPKKLSRYGVYDWRFEDQEIRNGPYIPTDNKHGQLTLSGTGNPVPNMTADNLPSGQVFYSSFEAGHPAYSAFDANDTSYWSADPASETQKGIIGYEFPTSRLITGYTVYIPRFSLDADYAPLSYAPADWTFEGSNNGLAWQVLDVQRGYVLYEAGRSVHFTFVNTTAYKFYRLNITGCQRNGPIAPHVNRLVLTEANGITNTTTIVLGGIFTSVNKGQGFLSTDVGRLVRMKDGDGYWRNVKIASVVNAVVANIVMQDEPFTEALNPIFNWQLGYFSDTLGWPTTGAFFDDRLYMAGCRDAPDLIAGSRIGVYNDFATRTPLDEVLDDSALSIRLNSRRVSRIRWLASDERGLLIGTGSSEYVLTSQSSDGSAITARSVKARESTRRGSADVEPAKIDRQVVYVQAGKRTIREFAYVFEADGYKSPSMSLFASHIGVRKFVEMDYASEPHSIIWMRREDGTLVGLTYNREENIIGWHEHELAGGIVESMSVRPIPSVGQDVVSFVMRRIVNGEHRKYIERFTRFWDFDSTLENAWFVDSGLQYTGDETSIIQNLWHLEGELVDGIADGIPFSQIGPVSQGDLTLPNPASNVIVGRFSRANIGEISRMEAGAADGTSQGKVARINNVSLHLWATAGGQFGVRNEQTGEIAWTDILYPEPGDELEGPKLYTGFVGPHTAPSGYGKDKTILFRQTEPLPFNLIAVLPQFNTQDR